MERHGNELVKIWPPEFLTLRECVIASFEANGPMTNGELYRSLPMFNKMRVRKLVMTLPDELTGRGEWT